MKETDVIRKIMIRRGWSQPKLARESGFKNQSNVSGLLNNNKNSMRVDSLFRMLHAMGFELIARDKMGSGKEFVIDMGEDCVGKRVKFEDLSSTGLKKQATNTVVNLLNRQATFALHEEAYSATSPYVLKVLATAEFEIDVDEDNNEPYIRNAIFNTEDR